MPKTVKSRGSIWQRTPKVVYGAAGGALIGLTIVLTSPGIALSLLIGLMIVAGYVFFLSRQRAKVGSWSPRAFSPAPVLGALVIGVMSIAGVQYLGLSLAWHPQGTIKKTVQNVTTNGPIVDANSSSSAITVKPGDILNYTIVISNVAPNASNQYNDMAFTVLTDSLPSGVELVSDPTKRNLSENHGTILPGKSVTTVYQVKVKSVGNGTIIENKACFTANSVVKDNPQKGCDPAVVKVQVPVTPPTPTPPTPTPPTPTPPTPTPPTPTPPTPTPPTPTPPTPTPPTPTPPTPTPPTPTPPTPTPPTPTPPTPTPPTPTPPTSIVTTPEELPNVGAGSIIVIALFAAVIGYLFTAVYGFMNGGKAKRFQ